MFNYDLILVLGQAGTGQKVTSTEGTTTDSKAVESKEGSVKGETPIQQDSPSMTPLLIMAGVFAFFMFTASRSKKKEARRKTEMTSSLKQGTKVVTIGGMMGTVQTVRENSVVVKLDESNQTKVEFEKSAIKTVLDDKK